MTQLNYDMAPRAEWLNTLFPTNAERTVPWLTVKETVTLYRPTGLVELRLVAGSDWRAWPPRLPDQPIFYPVLNQSYAEEIARDWNAKRNDPPVGFVTRFDVRSEFALRYAIQIVGRQEEHQELWIPAKDIDNLNANLVGCIKVISHFTGPECGIVVNPSTHIPLEWR